MTEHPARGMTKAQIAAFEQIAIGQGVSGVKKTIDRLLERGLIVRIGDKVLGRDRFGTITIPQFEVPIPVHAHWCQWASENYREEDEPMKNEKTSDRVASIAGRVLAVKVPKGDCIHVKDQRSAFRTFFKWSDIRAIAASALTQTADRKPKAKRTPRKAADRKKAKRP